MATDNIDPEKGLISSTARSTIPSYSSSTPDNAITNKPSGHTPLELFQLLVGTHTPPSLLRDGSDLSRATGAKRGLKRTDNVGLYQRAKQQERASRISFVCTSIVSNTLYMLQILFAATFTALSAYKNVHPEVLTGLGAINTVLAGSVP